jgi:hypothetical protein
MDYYSKCRYAYPSLEYARGIPRPLKTELVVGIPLDLNPLDSSYKGCDNMMKKFYT